MVQASQATQIEILDLLELHAREGCFESIVVVRPGEENNSIRLRNAEFVLEKTGGGN